MGPLDEELLPAVSDKERDGKCSFPREPVARPAVNSPLTEWMTSTSYLPVFVPFCVPSRLGVCAHSSYNCLFLLTCFLLFLLDCRFGFKEKQYPLINRLLRQIFLLFFSAVSNSLKGSRNT